MLTDTTMGRTPTAAGNLPRPGGGDAKMEAPRPARPRRLRGVGAAAARLALVAGLAVALLVGALALGPRNEAAASWRCQAATLDVAYYLTMGDLLFANGEYEEAGDYYVRAAFLEGVITSAGCS